MNMNAWRFDSVLFCPFISNNNIDICVSVYYLSKHVLFYGMDNGQHHQTDDNSRMFCLYNCSIVMFFSSSIFLDWIEMTWTSIDKHMIICRFAFTRLDQTILYA
jgi:hypothetical protein